jgi:hypothetical protein
VGNINLDKLTSTPEGESSDTTAPIEPAEETDTAGSVEPSPPNRSTIEFPYGSLKDGEQIAGELHRQWGDSASPEQLAGGMDSSPRSGAFRIKVAAARMFGLVNTSRGNLSLSALGRRVIASETRPNARVEAFLSVALFNALFREYNGAQLPPDAGLEKKIEELGVTPKQVQKARQSFQRSADLAGFFRHGRSRLVQPPTDVRDSGESSSKRENTREEGERMNPPAPILPASNGAVPFPDLWLTLLREGHSWSAEETHEFVEHARKLHEFLAKHR